MTSFVWAHIIPIQSRRRDALLKVRQHLAQSEGFILQSLLAAGLGLAVALVVLAFHGLIDLLIMAVGEPSSWEIWQVLALPTLGALIVFADIETPPKTGQLRPKARGQ